MIDHSMVTTGFELDNYRIIKTFGITRGIIVRSRSIFGSFGASIQTIFGGNITILSSLCENTREEAFELMIEHAEELGANAVIGMHYDTCELMAGVSEVLAYGTAVLVERK